MTYRVVQWTTGNVGKQSVQAIVAHPDLERWAYVVGGLQNLTDAYVYFKHEEQGLGPDFARRFIERLPEAVRAI